MSINELDLIVESATRLAQRSRPVSDARSVWASLEAAGMARIGLPEHLGGDGGTLAVLAAVIASLAKEGVALPVGESSLVAGWMVAQSGVRIPSGMLVPMLGRRPIVATRAADDWQLDGEAEETPFAASADHLVVLAQCGQRSVVAIVDPAAATIIPGRNIAGEPRDRVALAGVRAPAAAVALAPEGVSARLLYARGALVRSIQIAAVLECVLTLTARYAADRVQFGRPIARQQVIQQYLALIAGEVAATRGAVDLALEDPRPERIAMAKVQAGEAAGLVARLSHQIHGAIGFTDEHELHHHTLRLWAWRDEYGADVSHAVEIGEAILRRGPDVLWDDLTDPLPVGVAPPGRVP